MTPRHPHSTAPGRSPSRIVDVPHVALPTADQVSASQADLRGLTFSVSVSALQYLIIEVLQRPIESTLASTVGVVDETCVRSTQVDGHHQRIDNEFRAHVIGDGPADDTA